MVGSQRMSALAIVRRIDRRCTPLRNILAFEEIE